MAKITKINGVEYITYSINYTKYSADETAKVLKGFGYKTAVRKISFPRAFDKGSSSSTMYAVYRSKTK
jgi:hypothetical protein